MAVDLLMDVGTGGLRARTCSGTFPRSSVSLPMTREGSHGQSISLPPCHRDEGP